MELIARPLRVGRQDVDVGVQGPDVHRQEPSTARGAQPIGARVTTAVGCPSWSSIPTEPCFSPLRRA